MVRFHRFSLRSNPTETQIAIFGLPDRGKADAPEGWNRRKCWGNAEKMAPQVGLEPTTLRLTAGCSAIELLRNAGRSGTAAALLDE